jgi:hypothetical protein
MFIPDPDFTHPGSKNSYKREGEKKIFVKHFFVATNFTKFNIILVLNCSRKKFGPNFKEVWNFLPKKLSLSSQNPFRIPDPGVKKAPDPGSGSATLLLIEGRVLDRCWAFDRLVSVDAHLCATLDFVFATVLCWV